MFKISESAVNKAIKLFLLILEKTSNYFITYHLRPKEACKVKDVPTIYKESASKKIAIVMQGPIISDNNFTIETIKLYSKLFPQNQLIFSTWEEEDLDVLNTIRNLSVDLVLNKKPDFSGSSNINFQIVSTSEGVKRARELGCNYVFKTRSDQRIYAKDAISLCYACLKKFPLIGVKNQVERIVSFNLNTFKYRPYGISDMNNFGHIDDMEKYWCIDLDTRREEDFSQTETLEEYSRQRYAEVYFVTSFLKNIDREIEWTLKDSWQVISENFCILDVNSLDLFWRKYTHKEFRHLDYESITTKQFEFTDWLIWQINKPLDIPEYIIKAHWNELDSFELKE